MGHQLEVGHEDCLAVATGILPAVVVLGNLQMSIKLRSFGKHHTASGAPDVKTTIGSGNV